MGLHQEHDYGRGPKGRSDLVVSAADGPLPQTREPCLARQVKRPALVVYMKQVATWWIQKSYWI